MSDTSKPHEPSPDTCDPWCEGGPHIRTPEEHLDAIRAAAKPLRSVTWAHDDNCEHRYCDEPDHCEQGGVPAPGDHCESPDVECSCGVLAIARLLAAIGEP